MQVPSASAHRNTQKFFKRNEVDLAKHAESRFENEEHKEAVFVNFTDGVGLGIMEFNKRLMTIKTFLPHSMLKDSQHQLVEHIKNPEEVAAPGDEELMLEKVKMHLQSRLD